MNSSALPAPGLSPLAGATTPSASTRHSAEAFTAVAIGEMLTPMFAAVNDTGDQSGGEFGGGAGEAAFRPMMIEQMAAGIAHQGGFGITDQVAQAMLRLQESKE
jgi:Rod binding domain-containing protein